MTARTLKSVADDALRAATAHSPDTGAAPHIAFKAMRALYPTESSSFLGFALSYPVPNLAETMADLYHGVGLFGDVEIDHVVGCLVAPLYGERAL